jgi:hypothetical protein
MIRIQIFSFPLTFLASRRWADVQWERETRWEIMKNHTQGKIEGCIMFHCSVDIIAPREIIVTGHSLIHKQREPFRVTPHIKHLRASNYLHLARLFYYSPLFLSHEVKRKLVKRKNQHEWFGKVERAQKTISFCIHARIDQLLPSIYRKLRSVQNKATCIQRLILPSFTHFLYKHSPRKAKVKHFLISPTKELNCFCELIVSRRWKKRRDTIKLSPRAFINSLFLQGWITAPPHVLGFHPDQVSNNKQQRRNSGNV